MARSRSSKRDTVDRSGVPRRNSLRAVPACHGPPGTGSRQHGSSSRDLEVDGESLRCTPLAQVTGESGSCKVLPARQPVEAKGAVQAKGAESACRQPFESAPFRTAVAGPLGLESVLRPRGCPLESEIGSRPLGDVWGPPAQRLATVPDAFDPFLSCHTMVLQRVARRPVAVVMSISAMSNPSSP